MDQTGLTSEFSICLTLNHEATEAVEAIRQMLAASPYRDDTPHVTLLRTIKTPKPMSDSELAQDMERLLDLSKSLPLTTTVRKPANGVDPLFRWFSSRIVLRASPEIKSYRKRILRTLQTNNYSVGILSRLTFFPHVSVRLGVPYTEKAKAMAQQSFSPETKIILGGWVILRDIKKDGKYLVREVVG